MISPGEGREGVEVRADAFVTYNGRPSGSSDRPGSRPCPHRFGDRPQALDPAPANVGGDWQNADFTSAKLASSEQQHNRSPYRLRCPQSRNASHTLCSRYHRRRCRQALRRRRPAHARRIPSCHLGKQRSLRHGRRRTIHLRSRAGGWSMVPVEDMDHSRASGHAACPGLICRIGPIHGLFGRMRRRIGGICLWRV